MEISVKKESILSSGILYCCLLGYYFFHEKANFLCALLPLCKQGNNFYLHMTVAAICFVPGIILTRVVVDNCKRYYREGVGYVNYKSKLFFILDLIHSFLFGIAIGAIVVAATFFL